MKKSLNILKILSLFCFIQCYTSHDLVQKRLQPSEIGFRTQRFLKENKTMIYLYGSIFATPQNVKLDVDSQVIFEGVLIRDKLGYAKNFTIDNSFRKIILTVGSQKFKIVNESYPYITISLNKGMKPVVYETNYMNISDGDGTAE
ncbi:hypothetical protein JI747_018800 [Chryseobacterium sp. RG1]|uniref:DUF4369 domain-containing protein n=1 Tax=Chryseobacterium tagetis TaxID=2801334 RepID=A0ABS8A611_9FLAO|nr:hypothetical protein [Chryseobacterium tagetis]MCA6069220.1 hypothetical protein [Chryseobacterium tagetis]